MLSNEKKEKVQKMALEIPHQHLYPPILKATIKSIEKDIKNTVNDARTVAHLEEQKEIAKVKLQAVLDNLKQHEQTTKEGSNGLGGERVHQEEEDDADVQLPSEPTVL